MPERSKRVTTCFVVEAHEESNFASQAERFLIPNTEFCAHESLDPRYGQSRHGRHVELPQHKSQGCTLVAQPRRSEAGWGHTSSSHQNTLETVTLSSTTEELCISAAPTTGILSTPGRQPRGPADLWRNDLATAQRLLPDQNAESASWREAQPRGPPGTYSSTHCSDTSRAIDRTEFSRQPHNGAVLSSLPLSSPRDPRSVSCTPSSLISNPLQNTAEIFFGDPQKNVLQ